MSKPITDLLWKWDPVRLEVMKLLKGRPPIYLTCVDLSPDPKGKVPKPRAQITALLMERGIKYKDLCAHLGVTTVSLRNKFNGRYQLTDQDVEAISGYTGLSPEKVRECVKAEEYE